MHNISNKNKVMYIALLMLAVLFIIGFYYPEYKLHQFIVTAIPICGAIFFFYFHPNRKSNKLNRKG